MERRDIEEVSGALFRLSNYETSRFQSDLADCKVQPYVKDAILTALEAEQLFHRAYERALMALLTRHGRGAS
jgi:hypothetical protein